MLYLNPPFHVVDDIVLFPDHLNEDVGGDRPIHYYYAPVTPHLSKSDAGWQLRLFKFADDSPSAPKDGGLLNLQVELGISQSRRQSIIKEMAKRLGVPEPRIQVAPIMFSAGDVQMFVLDGFSGKGELPKDNSFVKQLDGTKPALHSNNQALFSVMLSPKGATFVEQALKGEMSAIGISYTLQFAGLKPAYRVRVQAKWEEVLERVSSSVGSSFIVSSDIRKITEELTRNGLIRVEADTYVTDGEVKGVAEELAGFQDQLVDLVTEKFFTPMVSPEKPDDKNGGQGGFVETVSSLVDIVGKSRTLFHFNEEKAHKSLKGDLTAEAFKRVTVTRSLVANGFLTNIIGEADVGNVVSLIDLSDDFYKRRTVDVKCITPFEANSIASIDVTLRYGPKVEYWTLSREADTKTFVWNSLLDSRGGMKREVEIDYKVNFKRDEIYQQRGPDIELKAAICKQNIYEIVAYRDLFDTRNIEIQVDSGFPWNRYPRVEVELRYEDEEHRIKIEKTVRLTASAPRGYAKLFMRVADGRPFVESYDYRVTYVGNPEDGVVNRQTDWQAQSQIMVVIADPAPYRRKLHVDAEGVDWRATKNISLLLRYNDASNGISESGRLVLDAKKFAGDLTFNVKDLQQRWIEYDVVVRDSEGATRRIDNCRTRDDDLFFDDPISGTRQVEVVPEGKLSSQYPQVVAYFLGGDKKEKAVRFSKDRTDQIVLQSLVEPESSDSVQYRVEYLNAREKVASRYPQKVGQYVSVEGKTVRVPLTPPR